MTPSSVLKNDHTSVSSVVQIVEFARFFGMVAYLTHANDPRATN